MSGGRQFEFTQVQAAALMVRAGLQFDFEQFPRRIKAVVAAFQFVEANGKFLPLIADRENGSVHRLVRVIGFDLPHQPPAAQ